MSNSLTLTIRSMKAQKADLTAQIIDNQEALLLTQKYSSTETERIGKYFEAEEERIKLESGDNPDALIAEYTELMDEDTKEKIKELKDEKDQIMKTKTEELNQAETIIQIENEQLQTRIQAITADLEGFEEARKQNIEEEYAYFQ